MAKLKPKWVKTDIPKDTKVKLWRIMKNNPTYETWQKGVARASYEFDTGEEKYVRLSRDTYSALQDEIRHIPAEEVMSLTPDLQSWVKQSRPELEENLRKTHSEQYEETTHKREMRGLARDVIQEIRVPWILDSFIISLKPGRLSLGRDDLRISITQSNKIEVPLSVTREGKLSDPHEALRSHLRTGGFSELLDEIELWRQGVADNRLRCHRLLGVLRRGLERAYKTSIPLDYRGEPGFTIWFPMTICADAVEQARGSSHFGHFPYNYEGSGLRFGAFLVYQGMPNQDLNPYEVVHRQLRTKCAKWERVRDIAKQREELSQTQAQIGRLLQKFIDMERLPGRCELCHQ